ncbi:DUF6090 family protein [uncultured Sunxiuqinia sp.]|uniref:DUF6090 family protein n=1 Tax=uncultured Sunxiuqinia sp. TaxID=1573825 RepID=UPI00261CDBE7|nr:DUF6090 family protein [uncultured Sunxiuqinia sp.]
MLSFFHRLQLRFHTENKIVAYLLYAIGEIVLLVIGILLALQINNWNSRRLDQEEARKSYQNIKRQLLEDRIELGKVKDLNNYFAASYVNANRMIANKDVSKADSLALMIMGLSQYSDFYRSGNIYEILVNSGEIKLLKNIAVTSGLQKLEMTYTHLNKLEDIHWEIILNELSPEVRGAINYATLEIVKPEKLYSVEIRNFLIESLFLTQAKDSVYKKAQLEINQIIDQINSELKSQ